MTMSEVGEKERKQHLQQRVKDHTLKLAQRCEELPSEKAERLMAAQENNFKWEEKRFAEEASGAVKSEEKKIDNMLKRVSNYLKESDIVADFLQGTRLLFGAFIGLSLDKNPAYNELSDVLLAVSAAGLLINVYRNRGKNWHEIVKREHKAKRSLKNGSKIASSAFDKAEDKVEREMHPAAEEIRVIRQSIFSVHRRGNGNGFHRHAAE